MAKGIRKERNLGEEVMSLDAVLLMSVRRNLDVAKKLERETVDAGTKEKLAKFIRRHLLAPKSTIPDVKREKLPATERERQVTRLSRLISFLSISDLGHVTYLVKSMRKTQNEGVSEKVDVSVQKRKGSGPTPVAGAIS